ncbi:hypothetical protein PROFUN_03887 [Planoprotostelium fungivorum]|uniref:Uncharacterized protein n=1 Tax=Planoprotostelium fungivorum TaxID=1890364 RepID=A0A2P6MTL5_9EUKA|nr:hypothetical protein PROFUN_03887 [Planoprotostelium fungivorum]
MVLIDREPSSHRALRAAIAELKSSDTLYLFNITSTWDYLNDERNSGKTALYEAEEYAIHSGATVSAKHAEAHNIRVFIGAGSFRQVAEETNMIFSSFSYLTGLILGSVVNYVKSHNPSIVQITQ